MFSNNLPKFQLLLALLILIFCNACVTANSRFVGKPLDKPSSRVSVLAPNSRSLVSLRRENIAYFAMSLSQEKIAYKYAGRTTAGFDCSGFTSYVFKYFNYEVSPSSAAQAQLGNFVPLADTRPGDLVFFSHNGKTIGHVALVTRNLPGQLYVTHATNSNGVIEQEILNDKYWAPRIKFARNVLND